MQTEIDQRIKAIWELHRGREREHLRLACEAMKNIEGMDPAEFLPANGMPEPMTFEPNKEYVRDVLERTVDLTAFDAQFIPIDDLPDDHRYFEYQATVNAGGSPTELVITRHRDQRQDDGRVGKGCGDKF